MSEETTVVTIEAEEPKDKARAVVKSLVVDVATKSITFSVDVSGKIKSGKLWSIDDAKTVVKGKAVPIAEFIIRVIVGWFWVRKVQDVLRRGNRAEAIARLAEGYDWAEETATTRKAKVLTPKEHLERGLVDMTKEDRLALIERLKREAEELEKAEAEAIAKAEAEKPEEEPEQDAPEEEGQLED